MENFKTFLFVLISFTLSLSQTSSRANDPSQPLDQLSNQTNEDKCGTLSDYYQALSEQPFIDSESASFGFFELQMARQEVIRCYRDLNTFRAQEASRSPSDK